MTFVFKHPSKYKKVKEETMVKSFKEVEEIKKYYAYLTVLLII